MTKSRQVLGKKPEEKTLEITASSVGAMSQPAEKTLGVYEEIGVGSKGSV